MKISGCGFVSNQYIICAWNSHFKGEKHMFVAENFIRSLFDKYGRHRVYTDG